MNINFDQITFRNFLSYGNNLTTFKFSGAGTTLIIGENLDQTSQGSTSNGAGKTTTINALVYALYDKPLSDISKDNLINNINKKNMEVTVEFSKGDIKYKIKRERKAKNGNNVYLWIDDVDSTLDSVAHTNELIEEILGIPYELFIQIVVFSATTDPFLKLKKAEQTEMFERLVGLTMLSDKAEVLKGVIKDSDTNLKFLKNNIELLEAEKYRHNDQLTHAKSRLDKWQEDTVAAISSLTDELSDIVEPDYIDEQRLHELLPILNNQLSSEENKLTQVSQKILEITTLKNKLVDMGKIDFDKEQLLFEELSTINTQLTTEQAELSQATQKSVELNKLNNQLGQYSGRNFDKEEATLIELDNISKLLSTETIKHTQLIKDGDKLITSRNRLGDELTHLKDNKCPYCSQQYNTPEAKAKLIELNNSLIQLEADIELSASAVGDSGELLEKLHDQQSLLSKQLVSPTLQQLTKTINEYNNIVSKIELLQGVDVDVIRLAASTKSLEDRCMSIKSQLTTPTLRELIRLKGEWDTAQSKIDELEDLNEYQSDLITSIGYIKTKIDTTKDQLTTPSLKVLMQLKSDNDAIRNQLKSLQSTSNPHLESYQELVSLQLPPIRYEEANELTKLIEHQKLLLKLLTKRDSYVRRALLNKYIPYLNTRLQYYLMEMGLPHKVEFTHEMTASISSFGRNLDYGQLSNGQQARVNLSLSLAFSDVLQKLHSKINITLFDEILDEGLDTVGVLAAVRILKERVKNDGVAMYIISHRDEVENIFDNIMTIQMKKGFSYIKNDELEDMNV
jgi:DNA repair exonuclease SbcCD ATPase subunit